MLAIKFVLLSGSLTALVAALFILLFDAHKVTYSTEPVQIRWRRATRLMLLAVILLLPGLSIVRPRGAGRPSHWRKWRHR